MRVQSRKRKEKYATTFRFHVLSFGRLANVDGEHDDLGCHSGHLVAEAELIDTIHMCSNGVLSAGLTVSFVNLFTVRTSYLQMKQ
jgi:hypothetical protein